MKRFKTYVEEGKYPVWVRVTVGTLVMRIRNLSSQIENETDPVKQNALLAQQNKLISYINGLGIGVLAYAAGIRRVSCMGFAPLAPLSGSIWSAPFLHNWSHRKNAVRLPFNYWRHKERCDLSTCWITTCAMQLTMRQVRKHFSRKH